MQSILTQGNSAAEERFRGFQETSIQTMVNQKEMGRAQLVLQPVAAGMTEDAAEAFAVRRLPYIPGGKDYKPPGVHLPQPESMSVVWMGLRLASCHAGVCVNMKDAIAV